MVERLPSPEYFDEALEQEPPQQPAIYVMCLEDWRVDREHAEWISAVQEAEDIQEDIQRLLERSVVPDAREWAIHDEVGFHGLAVGDLSFAGLSVIGRGIAEHGEPFARWIGANQTEYDSAASFNAAYHGTFESLEDFAVKHLGRRPGIPLPSEMVEHLKERYYLVQSEAGLYVYQRGYLNG